MTTSFYLVIPNSSVCITPPCVFAFSGWFRPSEVQAWRGSGESHCGNPSPSLNPAVGFSPPCPPHPHGVSSPHPSLLSVGTQKAVLQNDRTPLASVTCLDGQLGMKMGASGKCHFNCYVHVRLLFDLELDFPESNQCICFSFFLSYCGSLLAIVRIYKYIGEFSWETRGESGGENLFLLLCL